MTREIKFRLWSGSKMYDHREATRKLYDISCGINTFPEDKIMQYTGLEKKGKEIWEGDLMTTAHKTVGEVVFYRDSWYVYAKVPVMHGLEEYAYVSIFSCEDVVGNKFENPELLTK